MIELHKGDIWKEGSRWVEIVDCDRLCYRVMTSTNNCIRTISKDLVNEFYEYIKDKDLSLLSSVELRKELSGLSNIDKFEYGYDATLFMLAKACIAIGKEGEDKLVVERSSVKDSYSIDELARRLRDVFVDASSSGNRGVACLLFGFKYGKALADISCAELIRLCNSQYLADDPISENYHVEMAKGIKLFNIVDGNLLGMSFGSDSDESHHVVTDRDVPLQQIFFGAPGTGKSHEVKMKTDEWEKKGRVVRTTFHPDSDYSTFVGAYKPTTHNVPRYNRDNEIIVSDGKPVMDRVITYEFVAQAFLKAYVDAWTNREEREYLVIEEINRGNCAQIFGDLFQLLDRGDDGYSEYAIRTDKDMQMFLADKLKDAVIDDYPNVKNGSEMVLPGNMFIRATMNTSDQSLFPIDSAFKRRWDWKYVPIVDAGLHTLIEAGDVYYDWWSFVTRINDKIAEATNSVDKKIGYFFCKADKGVISADKFVSKVIFYLYNDVFKDTDDGIEIFKDEFGENLSFDMFYTYEHGSCVADKDTLNVFLNNLGVVSFADEPVEEERYVTKKFALNGQQMYLSDIVKNVVKQYADNHPDLPAEEIQTFFINRCANISISHMIETEDDFALRKHQPSAYRSVNKIVIPDGEVLYVSSQWQAKNPTDNFFKFMELVNKNGWGHIEQIS